MSKEKLYIYYRNCKVLINYCLIFGIITLVGLTESFSSLNKKNFCSQSLKVSRNSFKELKSHFLAKNPTVYKTTSLKMSRSYWKAFEQQWQDQGKIVLEKYKTLLQGENSDRDPFIQFMLEVGLKIDPTTQKIHLPPFLSFIMHYYSLIDKQIQNGILDKEDVIHPAVYVFRRKSNLIKTN